MREPRDMTRPQLLVQDLQAALGLSLVKGQITLQIADGVFQHAEYRVCGITGQELLTPRPVPSST